MGWRVKIFEQNEGTLNVTIPQPADRVVYYHVLCLLFDERSSIFLTVGRQLVLFGGKRIVSDTLVPECFLLSLPLRQT
jgi:hypothetical protein